MQKITRNAHNPISASFSQVNPGTECHSKRDTLSPRSLHAVAAAAEIADCRFVAPDHAACESPLWF